MQVSGGDGVVEWREAEYRGSEKLVSQLDGGGGVQYSQWCWL